MKKIVLILMILVLAAMLAACQSTDDSTQAKNAETATADVDVRDDTVSVKGDTMDDGSADVTVEMAKDEPVEMTVDFEEVQSNEANEALAQAAGTESYCVPGSMFNFDESVASINSEIIGLTMYKGSEFCKATSASVVETPVGTIKSESTYYFDSTYEEYWVITTVSGGPSPATTSEIHFVDGQIQ